MEILNSISAILAPVNYIMIVYDVFNLKNDFHKKKFFSMEMFLLILYERKLSTLI